MKYKSNVYKNFALITQFGLNIMVPTFLCLFAGLWIGKFLGSWVVLIFIFLGMAAGMRNCYVMAMNANSDKKGKPTGENQENETEHDRQLKKDN